MTQQEQLNDLIAVRDIIQNPLFQKFFVDKMRDKQDEIKTDFFADSLKDAWRKGGKFQGLNEFFDILKEINHEYKNARYEIENSSK